MMRDAGTDAVVATPHFYPNQTTLASFLARREDAAARLLAAGCTDIPKIFLGAEVLVCPGLQEMAELEKLAITGTRLILLEMPFRRWDNKIIETVTEIRERGLYPILAHIDRYKKEEVARLLRRGMVAQLNADGVAGLFAYLKNRRYLAGNTAVALGSDLHGAEQGGYKHFTRAVKRLGSTADAIFARSEALLEGALPLEQAIEQAKTAKV